MNLIAIPEAKINNLEASLTEINSKIEELLQSKPQPQDQSKWISKKEACQRLDVCGKTIDSYMKKGLLPFTQFKSKVYIKPSDIEGLLERHYVIKK